MPRKKIKPPRTRRGFGGTRTLPSGRIQARYTGPDGAEYKAPHTFASPVDAEGWIAAEKRLIDLGVWLPPEQREARAKLAGTTVAEWFTTWLPMNGRRETTQATYESIYRNRIAGYLGTMRLTDVSPSVVAAWVESIRADYPTTKKRNADAYGVLHTMFHEAVKAHAVEMNPCTVEGAGNKPKSRVKQQLTAEEFATVTDALPERYRLAVVLADHCAMRIGEWTELRRSDLVVVPPRKKAGKAVDGSAKIHIQRSVSFMNRKAIVGPGKTGEDRWVHLSPALVPALLEHLEKFSQSGADGLVFPNKRGDYCKHTRFRDLLAEASKATIGRRISPHDFRHHGATEFARTGATVREIMARLGHSTPDMAMRYQHASEQRDATLSAAMPVYLPGGAEKAEQGPEKATESADGAES